MEVTNHEEREGHQLATDPTSDAATLDIIRTETVLSRMPVHNLAKRGNVNIQILKTNADGKVELKWIVSYSDRYGQARQLAYKLDTIVINHHIDEQGRPLPKMICLGSLRDIADQLDLGGDTNKVRRALRQNASAFITAKFEYRGNDNSKKTLEADFTRYSVVFTGEQLPDGRRADSVYIILNEPYREVLNNAPVRPLDRAYMKELPPGAQRFYEIISYKMFSAIKNDYPHAKIPYSEYCTFSAQLRHYERQPVQDQMAKVIRPHKQSGYITGVRYEPTIDGENKPDWILYLTPGPKARAEFAVAHGRKPRKALPLGRTEVGEHELPRSRSTTRERSQRIEPVAAQPMFDPQLVAEFTRRGVTEEKAAELLANRKPGQDVIAQLEQAEQMVRQLQNTATPVRNPAGFYIRLIERNTPVQDGFETSAKRKLREENERDERERRAEEDAREEREDEYDRYCTAEVDRYIEANPAEFESIKRAKESEERAYRPTAWAGLVETSAKIAAKSEIKKKLPLLSFEEFVDHKKRQAIISLKPVPPSPDSARSPIDLGPEAGTQDPVAKVASGAEPAIDTESGAAVDGAVAEPGLGPEATAEKQLPVVTNEPPVNREGNDSERELEEQPSPDSAPLILFASESQPEEPGSDPIGPTLI